MFFCYIFFLSALGNFIERKYNFSKVNFAVKNKPLFRLLIGKNCNIAKGVTIGQENRGKRKGTPIIGDSVWIGTNAVIVGKIVIGDDVLIAPNAFVNCDVPSHSVVTGNPCTIHHRDNATEAYVERLVE